MNRISACGKAVIKRLFVSMIEYSIRTYRHSLVYWHSLSSETGMHNARVPLV